MSKEIQEISPKTLKPEEENTRASLELLYHISREFAGALDLRTVLQRVLFLSMKTVGAMSGSIIVMDDTGKPVEAALIVGAEVHDHTTQRLRDTVERGLAGWVVRNRQAALIDDTSRDDRWLARIYADEERGSPKSAVSAPLLVREKTIGVLTLVHAVPGFFTSEHLALVQAIADQASIAVLNARLYAESQHQARVMTALAESSAVITGSLNQEEVLTRILEQISQALQVQAVSLALVDLEKNELVFRAANGWRRWVESCNQVPVGVGLAGWAFKEGCSVVVHELTADPRFDTEVNIRTGIEARAIACVPIRSQGISIGVLEAINPRGDTFDADAQLVLTGIGSLAGTAIRHAQLFENLEAAHQRYRELFDDSIDPIVITDWGEQIVEANRGMAQITGISKEGLRTRTLGQLHEIDRTKTGDAWEFLRGGETITYESILCASEVKTIPVQVYVRQVEIEGVSFLQWTFRDITERKNLDSLRTDLISMIYHDLRSPLANVVSSLETVASMLTDQDDELLASLVSIGMRSTDRIQRLTNSLLDINRLEAGQPVGTRLPVDPGSLVREAVEIVRPAVENKRQEISTSLPAGLPEIYGDADMIRRVLVNLLENAIKYTPIESKIHVGGLHEAEFVQLWVQDTGPGIPKEDQERIFEKFARLSTHSSAKGLGLGLTYCNLAVRAHGGRIWVESEPGNGARFIFTLLVAAHSPET